VATPARLPFQRIGLLGRSGGPRGRRRASACLQPREKTLADCFKFRHQVGLDRALEALKEYLRRGHPRVDDLVLYSEICRVRRVMRPYLEALL